MPLVFEWDVRKGKANRRKHGVSFDEASTVFDDPLARTFLTRIIPMENNARSSWDTRFLTACCW
jgi:uncharacterized DUF497 family protein